MCDINSTQCQCAYAPSSSLCDLKTTCTCFVGSSCEKFRQLMLWLKPRTSSFLIDCTIVRESAEKAVEQKVQTSTNSSTNQSTGQFRKALWLVDVFVEGQNFHSIGFPAELQRICYSHWTNGARNGVISIGQRGVFTVLSWKGRHLTVLFGSSKRRSCYYHYLS